MMDTVYTTWWSCRRNNDVIKREPASWAIVPYLTCALAGTLAGVIVVLRTVSYSAYIFDGDELSPYTNSLLQCMLLSGVGAQLVYTTFGELRGAMAGFSSTSAPILATMIG